MAVYEHICTDKDCAYEWEDEYSMMIDPPKICPKCSKETAKRLISLGGKGVVTLSGQDLVDKVKSDAKQLKSDMHKSDKVYSNLLGTDKYQQLQQRIDRQKR
jgi:putative FmdB family regulatory protein